ncbi:hypothetical protein OIHEL45_19616 [Sulfitobacter indolifex HEL-45]|uniref:Uncharacterized protein n=1 Tax=Sulfitobacter indolifex HEL-45 TaxID=391624 RepID=A0ABM9X0I9_9RHOB|nr:hypothetical protein OIHEL45_19616 [Sulfitobacter indolifex HEL-45]
MPLPNVTNWCQLGIRKLKMMWHTGIMRGTLPKSRLFVKRLGRGFLVVLLSGAAADGGLERYGL